MFLYQFGCTFHSKIKDNFCNVREFTLVNEWSSFFFLPTSLWHTYLKNFHFRSGNWAIHFPWVAKCFNIKKTSYIYQLLKKLYQNTSLSVYDLIFIDTARWSYLLIELFVLFKRTNQEKRIFLFLRLQRVSLYTVHKDCWFVFIFK